MKALPSKPCTVQDLETKFYSASANDKAYLWERLGDFTCFDSPVKIHGELKSTERAMLGMAFRPCEGTKCKSKQEIADFLSFGNILFLYNKVSFASDDFTANKVRR